MTKEKEKKPIVNAEDIEKALKIIDKARKEGIKDKEYGFNDDWDDFMKRMRVLTSQSNGSRIQNYIFKAFGWEKVDQKLDKGDVKNNLGQYFEVKVTTITTSNNTANIVQIRPWQKISGHHIFVIDSLNEYRVTHYFLTKSEMKTEIEYCANHSHGTKESNKENHHIEWSIRIPWKEKDKVFQRWKKYKQDTDIRALNSKKEKIEYLKCAKCKKKIKESESVYGYKNTYCKDCFKDVKKQAKKEVSKMFNKAGKEGLI